MRYAGLIYLFIFLQDGDVPFKPTEEFEVKFQFEFKERPRTNPNRIVYDQTQKEIEKSHGSIPLPYLFLNLQVLKQGTEEVRIRVLENGRNALNKKFDIKTVLKLDMGFTDDIKDRTGAYEYQIFFLSQDKTPVSRIIIYFEEDGTYLVNGQVRGKI